MKNHCQMFLDHIDHLEKILRPCTAWDNPVHFFPKHERPMVERFQIFQKLL
ncbi:hypothetical protein D3C87_2027200 [compost metagenome]